MGYSGGSATWTVRKALLVAALGGECVTCGESRLAALTFHHLPGERTQPGGQVLWNRPLTPTVWAEAFRCRLLCSNCHKIEHATNLGEQTAHDIIAREPAAMARWVGAPTA